MMNLHCYESVYLNELGHSSRKCACCQTANKHMHNIHKDSHGGDRTKVDMREYSPAESCTTEHRTV